MSNTNDRPKKLQRISQACDLCHRRSIRCRPSNENPTKQCQNCYDFAVDCTYNRPSRRRRNPSSSQGGPLNLVPRQQHPTSTSPVSPIVKTEGGHAPRSGYQNGQGKEYGFHGTGEVYENHLEGQSGDRLSNAWCAFAYASQGTIEQCLEVYMDVVYPLFPLFHGPSLWKGIRKQRHLHDRGFFASVMAACALAAARARDGAVSEHHHYMGSIEKTSETFFQAAQDAVLKDLTAATGLGYLRACALLALTSIQYCQVSKMHQYMGHYMTLSSIQTFHDETSWPSDITKEEREERRRLYWSMYSFEVYESIVFGSILQSQETHSNVNYPSEVTDEELSAGASHQWNQENWLRGWNFTTDLYRVLEHGLRRIRKNRQRREDRINVVRMMMSTKLPDLQILDNIVNLYYTLPQRFKDYKTPLTGDRSQDIFGFQAANIQATLQLVRITMFESNEGHNIHQKCDVAEQVLSIFSDISPHFLRAISTPLVYHLGSIGQILASVMQGVLTEESYERVRTLLERLADLLQNLEQGLQPAAGASSALRDQIGMIDQWMTAQRQQLASSTQARPTSITLPEAQTVVSQAPINGTSLPTISNALRTPTDPFQLPPELTGGWPWPFDLEGGQQLQNGYTQNHGQ